MDNSESDLRQATSLSPRIVNNLTICVYPGAHIVPLVSDLTGLDNYNLTDQSKFSKNNGELINSFLTLLPSPYFDSEMDGSPCDGLMGLSTKIEVSKHENEPRGQKNRPDMSFNPHKQKQTSCSEKFSIFKSKLSKILFIN